MNYIIKQGESRVIEIPVYENDLALDLTTATDIRVILNVKGIETKFSLTTISGYGILEIKPSPEEHIIRVELTREQSKLLPVGYINGCVILNLPDSVLVDGLVKQFNYSIGQIQAGCGLNEILI